MAASRLSGAVTGSEIMARGKESFDVIVVGGGLAGLTLAALLAARDVNVLCLDRDQPRAQLDEAFDGRTTAISYGSRKVLEAAGIWQAVQGQACAIDTIQILDGDSPVLLDFSKDEVGGRTFGWIIENRLLRRALFERVAALPAARHVTGAAVCDFNVAETRAAAILQDGRSFFAPLIVGADGRASFTREWMGIGARSWPYRQHAVVCVAEHDNPHNNIAVEHFRREGPFAILPMRDGEGGAHRSSIVWTCHGDGRSSPLTYDEDSFNAALAARFPDWYGGVRQIGRRFSYPLGLVHAHRYTGPRMALAAEAAHVIHPIAGQGLNIGLRDVAALAGLALDAVRAGGDPGAADVLRAYQRARRFDNMAMAGATDTLNRLFSNDIAPVRAARRAGLHAVARVPFAKRFFMKQAMGAAGLLPALMRN